MHHVGALMREMWWYMWWNWWDVGVLRVRMRKNLEKNLRFGKLIKL